MKNRLFSATAIVCISLNALASDPASSVYKSTTVIKDDANKDLVVLFDGGENVNRQFRFFSFADTDSLFGSLAVSQSGDAQTIKFNAVNYNLWFGGNYKLPFQLYVTTTANDDSDSSNQDKNELSMLDPESGIAIKFPLLWVYQSNGPEPCAFLEKSDVGHCSFGGDITFSLKNFEDTNGKTETAFGQTLRLGASVLFPVLDAATSSEQGYVSASAKLVYSHANIDDPTLLFTPVTDVDGNPVKFDKSILSGELELKFAINGQLSISAKWLAPFDNNDYFDDRFQITLASQF
ncbi:hypothetical protein [Rheinheimera nanhaiensis]|uniref:Uncharacterized protein n=1 Tax=Rheinheimera nanhaiensis E407-8 TaxID=562729 RepID=I1DUB6_9GAMM|nr:hypothetical protein [Rheinheimera nanhaiensis]GAB57644.1 hypothetical protein RNAN_0613 [Rheinheimera nanhaiensis E407-8]